MQTVIITIRALFISVALHRLGWCQVSKSIAVAWFACQRAMITYRVVLVLLGGYALAAAISLIAASFSSADGRELRSLINLVFCFCYALLIIVLFAINSHRKAWAVTLGANAVAWSAVMLSEEG